MLKASLVPVNRILVSSGAQNIELKKKSNNDKNQMDHSGSICSSFPDADAISVAIFTLILTIYRSGWSNLSTKEPPPPTMKPQISPSCHLSEPLSGCLKLPQTRPHRCSNFEKLLSTRGANNMVRRDVLTNLHWLHIEELRLHSSFKHACLVKECLFWAGVACNFAWKRVSKTSVYRF